MNTKSINLFVTAIVLLLLSAAGGWAQTYSNAVMNLNPVAYWPLQETNQPPRYDVETNLGSFGSIANAYYSNTNVLRGQLGIGSGDNDGSAFFNNTAFAIVPTTDSRVSLPPGGPFSVECWVRAAGTLGYRGLVCHTGPSQNGVNNSANGSGWEISINYAAYRFTAAPNSPRAWSFHVFNGVGAQTGGAEAETANTNWLTGSFDGYTNTWVYLCGVFDGTNCFLYQYSTNIDNATYGGTNLMNIQFPITAGPGTGYGGPPSSYTTGAQFSPDTFDPIQFGAERGIGANYWVGNIDEVAIYTSALSSNQVFNHFLAGTNGVGNYAATILADNPAMYWRMDATNWTPVVNSSSPVAANYGSAASSMMNLNTRVSGANAGVYQPGTVPGVPGPSYPGFGNLTNACAFNGFAGAVDAGYNPLLNPTDATNKFTMVAWFKGNPMDAGRNEAIASHSDSSWKAQINTGTASAYKGVGAQPSIAPARHNVNDGQWHMYTLESAPSGVTLNLDAAYIATAANSSFIPGNTNVDAWIGGAPDYMQPTNHATYNGNQQYFAGEICHVAYFTNVLTLEQINGLYSLINPALVLGTQPVSGTATVGDTYTTFVGASGQQLAFQWYKDNVAIPNQTNATLMLSPVQPSDASTNYYVIVTNSFGALTSSPPVSLGVYSTPVPKVFPLTYTQPITLYGGQIVSGTNYLGSTPTFSIRSVLGAKPFTYQWLTNGVAVDGANSTNFTFTNCQLDSPTNFTCIISNSYGESTNTWSASYLSAPMAPFPQAVLAANPITYWRLNEPDDGAFDGNPGAICNDYQSGNNGIYTNMYLSNATGGTGYSPATDPTEMSAKFGGFKSTFSFAGAIGTNIDFTTPAGSNGEFSVAVWLNGNATAQPANAGIVTKGVWSGEQFTLDEGAAGPSLRWVVRTPANFYTASSTTNLSSDSTWHYVVGVCDQANGKVYLYIDGTLVGSGAIPVGAGILPSVEPVSIGARKDSSGNYTLQFKGYLNDAAIYSYAMTPAQIVNQYASAGGANTPFFFPAAPANASAGVNATLTVPAAAVGIPPIGYVWTNVTVGGIVAAGVTNGNSLNATLSYSSALASTNQLQLIVTNAYGTISASVTLSVTNSVNLHPTNIVFAASSGNLILSWPQDHTGWTLQAQTNSLAAGIGTNWVKVANSSTTNQVIVPMTSTNGCVFYRLTYP